MIKANIIKKMFGIESGEVYEQYIIDYNDYTIVVLIREKENGEIVSYYVTDLIESKEV